MNDELLRKIAKDRLRESGVAKPDLSGIIDSLDLRSRDVKKLNKEINDLVTKMKKETERKNQMAKNSGTFGSVKANQSSFQRNYAQNAKNSAQDFIEHQKEKDNTDTITFRGIDYTFKPDSFVHDGYVFDPDHIPFIKYALNAIENGNIINIMALGEAGSGKTAFPKALSSMFNLGFYSLNCATMKNPTEWFGERGIQGGETVFNKSPFSESVEQGNGFILLDELNRTKENNRGPILSLLDDTRRVSIQDTDIKVGSSTIFYATANVGDDYTGTYTFDKAEFDRFPILKFKQMTFDREVGVLVGLGLSEKDSNLIVTKMTRIRENLNTDDNEIPFSLNVRKSIQISEMMRYGMEFADAIKLCISNGLSEDLVSNIDTIIKGNY